MSYSIFSPKLQRSVDSLENTLLSLSQYILIVLMVVVPIFFLPDLFISQSFSKTFFVLLGMLLSLVLYSFFILRVGTVRIVSPVSVALLWGVVALAVASALLSGDRLDALWGDVMQTQTVVFLGLLATIITIVSIVIDSRYLILRAFALLAFSALLLQLWHTARLLLGADFLSFGGFTSVTASPLGSFNDVALFSGLVIVGCIVSLLQFPLRKIGLAIVATLIVTSLFLLAVINFFVVWLVVGFFSLLIFLYMLTRDRLLAPVSGEPVPPVSRAAFVLIGIIVLVSAVFVVAGSLVGSALQQVTAVEYLEVRPSLGATLEVARAVYQDDAFLGIGPNRFEDAWRLHKDSSIAQTIFWNTNFTAGNSYLLTLFVSLGLFGAGVFLCFLGSFLYVGFRMLLRPTASDPYWYFVATTAFASSLYLWGMAIVYVPGPSMLILTAFWTGLSFAAYAALVPGGVTSIVCTQYRAQAFALIAVVMCLVTGAVSVLYVGGKQYSAHVVYAQAIEKSLSGVAIQEIDADLARAQVLFPSDVFVMDRVRWRLASLAPLLTVPEPTSAQIQEFQTLIREALELSRQAIALDATQPINHVLYGSTLAAVTLGGETPILDESLASMQVAQALDPKNPEYQTQNALLFARLGDDVRAREALEAAIAIKQNYTDALFLLAQIDIREGKTEDAIALTQAIISIEPQNPTRYFQLGALLAANNDLSNAITAFQAALQLDPNFANARYLLALAYVDSNQVEPAIAELRRVLELNPDNQELPVLIAQLESGELARPDLGLTTPVTDPNQPTQSDGVTTTNEVPETDLLTPLNRTSANNTSAPSTPTEETAPPAEVESGATTTPEE